VGHAVQAWSLGALGRELTVPDSTILSYYEVWEGYNPADPGSDQGGVELEVLNDWRQQGFDSIELDAYAAIGTRSGAETPFPILQVQQAIWLFGGLYIGVELPIRAQSQDVWDVAGEGPSDQRGSWGGHAVYVVGYDTAPSPEPLPTADCLLPTLTCITWGAPKKMTWAWFEKYCSEAYALVSKEWIEATGISASGFDLATLENDLALVTA
jgi:hypothetical protein